VSVTAVCARIFRVCVLPVTFSSGGVQHRYCRSAGVALPSMPVLKIKAASLARVQPWRGLPRCRPVQAAGCAGQHNSHVAQQPVGSALLSSWAVDGHPPGMGAHQERRAEEAISIHRAQWDLGHHDGGGPLKRSRRGPAAGATLFLPSKSFFCRW
jgi:hypothetical protein